MHLALVLINIIVALARSLPPSPRFALTTPERVNGLVKRATGHHRSSVLARACVLWLHRSCGWRVERQLDRLLSYVCHVDIKSQEHASTVTPPDAHHHARTRVLVTPTHRTMPSTTP